MVARLGAVSKSYGLMLDPLRHIHNPQFGAVIFRRTLADIKKEGSLWDTSMYIYGAIGGRPRQDNLSWRFQSGAKITFNHLENAATVLDWQGAQIAYIGFDEGTHFLRSQFFYLLSRNRSTCGIRPYMRVTTNPDADSWVADLIAWWIDDDGWPIPERSGVLRWFARVNEELEWADSREAIVNKYPEVDDRGNLLVIPKSLTFIPARLEDNAILTSINPEYRANLLALPRVERERLLGGNWKVRPAAGLYFRRDKCQVIDAVPSGTTFVRGWDLAATPKREGNDPDWTCGTKLGRMPDGRFIVAHHLRMRGGPFDVERTVLNTASQDGKETRIAIPQDPAQAGKFQAQHFAKLLAGYTVRIRPTRTGSNSTAANSPKGAKISRFEPFSAQAEAGNVDILRGPWNEQLFTALEAFPESLHDDDVDAVSEAFNLLVSEQVISFHVPIVNSAPRALPW